MAFPSRSRDAVGRRDVLRLVPAALLLAACAPGEAAPDPLVALERAARSDAALAEEVTRSSAARADSGLAQAAAAIAEVRAEHARALRREIDRMRPSHPDSPSPRDPDPPRAPGSAEEATEAFRDGLHSARHSAAALVPDLPGYRAGLVGSIAASCAGLLEVLG